MGSSIIIPKRESSSAYPLLMLTSSVIKKLNTTASSSTIQLKEKSETLINHLRSSLEKDKTQGNNPYVYSEVPLKSSGWSCHCHLAWNLYDNKLESPIDNWSTCEKYLQQIELTVSGAPRIYIDNTRRVMLKDLALYEAEKKKAETNNQPVIFPIREELTTAR